MRNPGSVSSFYLALKFKTFGLFWRRRKKVKENSEVDFAQNHSSFDFTSFVRESKIRGRDRPITYKKLAIKRRNLTHMYVFVQSFVKFSKNPQISSPFSLKLPKIWVLFLTTVIKAVFYKTILSVVLMYVIKSR